MAVDRVNAFLDGYLCKEGGILDPDSHKILARGLRYMTFNPQEQWIRSTYGMGSKQDPDPVMFNTEFRGRYDAKPLSYQEQKDIFMSPELKGVRTRIRGKPEGAYFKPTGVPTISTAPLPNVVAHEVTHALDPALRLIPAYTDALRNWDWKQHRLTETTPSIRMVQGFPFSRSSSPLTKEREIPAMVSEYNATGLPAKGWQQQYMQKYWPNLSKMPAAQWPSAIAGSMKQLRGVGGPTELSKMYQQWLNSYNNSMPVR